MLYVFVAALVIYAFDVFLASWKAMTLGAAAIAMFYMYVNARETNAVIVRARLRRARR